MLIQYFQAALEHAHYEIIDDEEPYYGEIPELTGIWATGKTLEQCRSSLASVLEDWLLFSIAKCLPIPQLSGITINQPELLAA